VETLRSRGYGIVGAPAQGYRLESIPDRLYHLPSTDSTNRVATELARAGAPHGSTVVAESQTAGRGRLGRSFFSPANLNLYTSHILRPTLTTAAAPTTILAAAVAVAEAVSEESGDPGAVEIKWPNDVLLGGLKTSGILMELAAEATRVHFLILGIGVNLNVDREFFPAEFRHLATSLASHTGRPVDRLAFARRLYGTLEDVLDLHAEGGFDAVRPRFERFFRMQGGRVRVADLDDRETAGRATGIDTDGALLVEDARGVLHRVVAGDVTVLKEGTPG
jgi:BirA family biotin operon repressor/biotin-[acetyl-CoA-carboxylase] ligase